MRGLSVKRLPNGAMKRLINSGRRIGSLAAAGMILLTGAAAAQTQPAASAQTTPAARQGVLYRVNDKIITNYDVTQRVIWLVTTLGIQPTEANLAQLQREATQSLIEERLQEGELERQEGLRQLEPGRLFATEEDIDNYIANIAEDNNLTAAEFLGELTNRGLSVRSIRKQVKILISWQRWTRNYYGQLIRISDDRIDARIRAIEASASQPSYLISEIFVSNDSAGGSAAALQTANQILTQLQQQGRFEPLARQYSALPTAARGGDAGWMSTGELRPEVVPILEQLRPGQVSRPITLGDGVYIVLLRERQDGGGSTQVSLKQVFVPLAASADDATAQAARAQLVAFRPQVTGCANLEQMAQTAGLQASDLGQAPINDLLPTFRDAVAELSPNQTSAPLRSENALHLVVLCNRTQTGGVEMPSRDEVAYQLREQEIAMIQRRELRNLVNGAVITQLQR